jgi:hypothetical protein
MNFDKPVRKRERLRNLVNLLTQLVPTRCSSCKQDKQDAEEELLRAFGVHRHNTGHRPWIPPKEFLSPGMSDLEN